MLCRKHSITILLFLGLILLLATLLKVVHLFLPLCVNLL